MNASKFKKLDVTFLLKSFWKSKESQIVYDYLRNANSCFSFNKIDLLQC